MNIILLICLNITIVDQLIKMGVSSLSNNIEVIKDFFNITYAENTGAAFSILNNSRFFLILMGFGAVIMIMFFFIKNKKQTKLSIASYGILLGGIVGNLFDRIKYGYVIDYLDFRIFGYNFPIFNLADIAIVIGCFLLIIMLMMEDKNGNKNN